MVHVLVNNAATAVPFRTVTNGYHEDGVEMTFATNVLAYHVLPLLLLPNLTQVARRGSLMTCARIVNITADYAGFLDLEDVNFVQRGYDMNFAYMQSKQADTVLTFAQAERFDEFDVEVNAMTPGQLNTRLLETLGPRARKETGARALEYGADTAVWLADSSECEGVSGSVFRDRDEWECLEALKRDKALGDRLWDICVQLSGVDLPARDELEEIVEMTALQWQSASEHGSAWEISTTSFPPFKSNFPRPVSASSSYTFIRKPGGHEQ